MHQYYVVKTDGGTEQIQDCENCGHTVLILTKCQTDGLPMVWCERCNFRWHEIPVWITR